MAVIQHPNGKTGRLYILYSSTKGALAVLAGICVSLQVSVKACNNFGGTADSMLLLFCQKFERLHGKSKVKPNMHLHGHLKECVLDYGPVYNFWCFSFERFNGILNSFKNNRCFEYS